jgi:hypothetical protein
MTSISAVRSAKISSRRAGVGLHVEVLDRVVPGGAHRVLRLALGAQQRGDDRDDQDADDDTEGQSGADLDDLDRLAVVDDRDVVLVQGVQDQLDADEGEDDGEAVAEVDEPVEQSVDEEVELAKPEEGERRWR